MRPARALVWGVDAKSSRDGRYFALGQRKRSRLLLTARQPARLTLYRHLHSAHAATVGHGDGPPTCGRSRCRTSESTGARAPSPTVRGKAAEPIELFVLWADIFVDEVQK